MNFLLTEKKLVLLFNAYYSAELLSKKKKNPPNPSPIPPSKANEKNISLTSIKLQNSF